MFRILTVFAFFFAALTFSANALDIQEVKSDKGLKILLVEDHSLPIVTLSYSFKSGTSQDPEGKSGALNLMSSLLDEGAGEMDAVAFQDRLEDLATRMSFGVSRDYFRGSLRTLNENADEAFEMLRIAIFEPRFDEKPMNRIRDQILSGIRAEANNPNSKASKALRRAVYPAGHPYIRTSNGTEESVLSVTADDLRALKKRILGRDNVIISMVGAITAEEAKKRIDALFGPLREKADLVDVPKVDVKVGEKISIDAPLPQTRYTLIGKGIDRLDPEYFAAYLVNQILGGSGLSSRLSLEVREKRGLAYGISSGISNHDAVSLFTASVATRADFADETLKVMRAELKRMADEGPSEEELDLAKSYTIGVYALNFDGSNDIASTLTSIQAAGLPSNYIEIRADAINGVTLDQAKAAAKRLLGDGTYTLLRVGPAAKKG